MMPPRRRHLRMVSSSDEEDEQPQQNDESDNISIELTSTINFESVSLNSTNPNPNPNPQPVPVYISDDEEFVDVSDNLSPPEQNDVADCAISGFLAGLGVRVRREWLDSCVRGLQSAVNGFSRLDDVAKAKLCFEQLLYSDMNFVGAGLLPGNVEGMHLVDLVGPFVLQVDEIVNISRPLKGRYQNAPSGHKRCLKLSMTDGVQRVFGMEYRPIKNLEVLAPAGMKVVVCNVNVRHGILMLVPEVIEVLGGQVEELDAARQRLVQEVNKPARGKRTKSGVVLPLESRATSAAWPPPNGVSAPTQTNISAPRNATSFQADVQGNTPTNVSLNQQTREESTVPIQRQQTREESTVPIQRQQIRKDPTVPIQRQQTRKEPTVPIQRQQIRKEPTVPIQRQYHEANNSSTVFSSLDDIQMVEGSTPNNVSINQQTREEATVPIQRRYYEVNNSSTVFSSLDDIQLVEGSTPNNVSINQQTREESTVPIQRQYHEANNSSTVFSSLDDIRMVEGNTPNNVSINQQTREESTVPIQRQVREASNSSTVFSSLDNIRMVEGNLPNDVSINQQTGEESTFPLQQQDHEANNSFTVFSSLDDIQMVDEVGHLPILTVDVENPFTYLASLSTKWAAMMGRIPNVQGKIKCFMTGVKSFQFRQRTTYELHAYVDDGSLISEILVSHDLVQQAIGHSPEEVDAAYRSPDPKIVNDMKQTLKEYQNILINFEGTMVVQISEASPFPVAIEMNQGCSASDAWGLLRRLRASRPVQQPDAINISP